MEELVNKDQLAGLKVIANDPSYVPRLPPIEQGETLATVGYLFGEVRTKKRLHDIFIAGKRCHKRCPVVIFVKVFGHKGFLAGSFLWVLAFANTKSILGSNVVELEVELPKSHVSILFSLVFIRLVDGVKEVNEEVGFGAGNPELADGDSVRAKPSYKLTPQLHLDIFEGHASQFFCGRVLVS